MRRLTISLAILAISMGSPAFGGDVGGEIRSRVEAWVTAIAERDFDAIEGLYADDAYFMPAGVPRVHGRAAIRKAWEGLLADPKVSLRFAPDEIPTSSDGSLAYEVGTYHMELPGPDGGTVKDVGKYVVVWRKTDAGWKVTADIFNSDGSPGT